MARHYLRASIDGGRGFGLKAFSEDELYTIHLATLEVLAQTGIRVECDRAMDIFEGSAVAVDRIYRLAGNKVVSISNMKSPGNR